MWVFRVTLWTEWRPGKSRHSSCKSGWLSFERLVVAEAVAVAVAVVAVVAEAAFCVLF